MRGGLPGLAKAVAKLVLRRAPLPDRLFRTALRAWLYSLSAREPRQALRKLLEIEQELGWRLDAAAIRYDDGVHAKHRLMRYHDFFVERVGHGEHVLDVGCGKGELAYDLATRAGATVTAVDIDRGYLAFARSRFAHPRVTYVEADARAYAPERRAEVVVLSNVLEHIGERGLFLEHLIRTAGPERLLLRVPAFDRHWSIPLRRELGMPYFSDPTHHVEYTVASFEAELGAARLEIRHLQVNWGEIWAEVRPVSA